ncbi:hypothetical protein M0805_008822 [Coniferiporia weirii]|nr:hypothetical protein M0805_008822 [Coniferiporia weirii]
MPPRRKSKRTAPPVEPDVDADNASQCTTRSTPPPHSTASFTVGPLLSDVDIGVLSNFFPDASFETPTPELIVQCYKLILNQGERLDVSAREIEEMRAEEERKDVEFDQALQDRENAVKELETSVDSVQNELNLAKAERDELATSRAALQVQLSTLSSSQSVSSSELDALKKKADEVEKEKRDLLGVISRLEEDAALREDEVVHLRENLKTARTEAQELESSLRDIRSTERATAFKVETLTHQLQLARDENERTNSELSKKSEEFSTYRRDKHTEIVQLQSELDALKQTHNQTMNTLRSLQSSHNSQSHQLSQTLQKVHDLTSQLADQDAKYSSEAANLRRLVQMMEEREGQAKRLVAGIEKDWQDLGEKAAASEQKLRDALEEEQQRSIELERELEDMKVVMDRINRGELPLPSAERTSSPNASMDGLFNLSPGLAMLNRMQKSGKTFTEVYAEYVKMQSELTTKTLEIDRLDRTLTDVLAELEERAPALVQQKIEIERIQEESGQLAAQLTQALAERDGFLSQIQETNQKHSKVEKENRLMQQQLDDLGRQLKTLLKELGRSHDPTLPTDEDMEGIPPAENIDAVITNNLVLYRSIPQLQEQNQKLLRIVRDLGARMETEESEYKEQLEREQSEAVREAHEAIQALQMQLETQQKSQQATIQAYVRERDTLKTMLARHERNGVAPGGSPSTPHVNGHAPEPSELEKELEEIRSSFDAYRQEMGVDSVKLREEATQYQREANQLGAALAKANAKIEFLNDRQRMVQERYDMQERESQALNKRNQQLHEQCTRLDIACNRASEELASALNQVERLRNECSNLRAEKKIWENVQVRLLEENKILSVERSRMTDLIGNVQKMHNDIDRANEGDRRRFESQIQSLENQAQDLRTQLSNERDNVRQATLQKDIEVQELRTKIDRTLEDLSKARESLVGAETSRKHLQDRVNDLLKQVQTSEEKLTVYERRTVPGSGTSHTASDEVSSEQQLRSEVAELRASLKAAEVDLATARGHVQQFQEISQASEAALQSLSSSHDEYKASSETQIAKFEAQQKSLDDKIGSLQEELDRLNGKNADLQQTLERERAAFNQDKKTLEDTIVDITNAGMNSQADQASRESDVREQMERAKVAEEKYSREVVAHAESIKAVDSLKQEISDARASIREKTMAVETLQANFTASEASWKQQRESLDKETSDLNARCKDLVAQNALLHQHLESINSQASRIRHAADSAVDVAADGSEADDATGRMAELRSVVAYLRKEKEIVDLQFELSRQENARLKTQIDHLSRSLEETRTTLSNEREEAANSVGNSAEHAELLERINQLNILRESNATLRAESDAHARKARQLETSLNKLQSELSPVKEEAKTLRAELEEKERQTQRLEDENRQWKERNSQLLTKYDRIDPNDVQALKDEIEDLQIDLRKAEEEKAAYTKEAEAQAKLLEDTSATLVDFRTKYQSLGQESRHRLGQLNGQIAKLNETVSDLRKQVKDLTAERDALVSQNAQNTATAAATDSSAEVEALNAQLSSVTSEKESAAKLLAEELEKSTKAAADHHAALTALLEERDKLIAEKAASNQGSGVPAAAEPADVAQIRQQLETEKAELSKARDGALARAKSAEERVAKILNEARNIRLQNEKFQTRIAENEKRRIAEGEKLAALSEKHKQDQEEAVAAAMSKLRFELQAPGADTGEVTARHAGELRTLEARLVAKHEEELKAAIDMARQEATNASAPTEAGHVSTEEHEQALKAAMERGRVESAAKLRLKESMLIKAQANVKHLEAQIKAWREAKIIPADAPILPTPSANFAKTGPTAAAATPVKAAAPAAATSVAKPSPAATAPPVASTSMPTPLAALPRKPSLNVTAAASASEASARGARGGVRGVRGVRGARGGVVRGGAPAAIAQAVASTTDGESVSIMGAAGKRGRDEADASETLAKRIKPAEGAGKPVALRRDRISTTNPAPPT